MKNAGLNELQVGIKIAKRNINHLRYVLIPLIEQKVKRTLMRVKEGSEELALNSKFKNQDHGILSHHFMANRWGKSGNGDRFYFLWLQNHFSDCSHEIKKCLLLGKKSYDKARQCIKKKNHYFADKGSYSQGYGFYPVVMYRWESWSIKKAEHQRTDPFELCAGEDSRESLRLQGDQSRES